MTQKNKLSPIEESLDSTEKTIRQDLRQSEHSIDADIVQRLKNVRRNAASQKNHWLSEYRNILSASLVTAALFAVVIIPQADKLLNDKQYIPETVDSVTLLMEDPEFYLWLNETGLLIPEG